MHNGFFSAYRIRTTPRGGNRRMRKSLVFQYIFTVSISFICGVIATQFIAMNEAQSLLEVIDHRAVEVDAHFQSIIVPLAISIIVVLLFSTHPYLYFIAPLYISLKSALFGFSSVLILEQGQSIFIYVGWWFPFQIMYIVLFIALYKICRMPTVRKNKKSSRLLPFVLIVIALLSYLEFVVLSYVLL
jgi:hypothetical protein